MKKSVWIISLVAVLAIVVYGILGVLGLVPLPEAITGMFSGSDDELTDMERIPQIIQDEYPTELILLGEEIAFETNLPVRTITEVTEASLKSGEEYQYTFFIVNDLNNQIQLTKDEVDLIAKKISQPNFCLTYLGSQYSSTWDDPNQYVANLDGNLFCRYFILGEQPRRCIGAWTQDDQAALEQYPYMLGNTMLYEIEAYLLEVN